MKPIDITEILFVKFFINFKDNNKTIMVNNHYSFINKGENNRVYMTSTNIREIRTSSVEIKNLDKPTLIAGFPGPGLVGSISTSYIIDTLKMHQIACIESECIAPGVVYFGGKLRHPFRLYANEEGNVCVAVCEAPIMINGIHLVMDILMRWALENNIQEVIVLDGIPLMGIPKEGRQPIILHDDNGLHKEEKRREHSNQIDNVNDGELDKNKKKNSSNLDKKAIENSIDYNYTAYIGGITGGLLSSCLSYGISCTAILVPSPQGLPDPEGAALLIESFNKITNNKNLKIDPNPLKEQGISIRQQLEKIMQSVEEQRQQASPEHKLMYG